MDNQNIKGKLIYINCNEFLGNIGEETPLRDVKGKVLLIGDVVKIDMPHYDYSENSIVCTKNGNIMGLWRTDGNAVHKFNIRKIKSYTELKDGEIYQDCVKAVLDKPIQNNKINNKQRKTNDNIKKLTLQEQLDLLKKQVESVKQQIKQENKKKEENIKETICVHRVIKTEKGDATQYINKDKFRLIENPIKTCEYNITFKRNGRKIICGFDRGDVIGIGVAKCSPSDEFNYYTGMVLAELRARSDFYKKIADIQSGKM